MIPFIPYTRQSIDSSDLEAVSASLQEEMITRGPPVKAFEEAFAQDCGATYAVAFCNGTAALMAAYFAADLNPFDPVFSTPNTFIASVGIPIRLEGRLQFVDIDLKTGNMDIEQLKPHLRAPLSRGRPFVIPVHFGGIAMDMAALNLAISHPDTVIIEDAAHAVGSLYPTGEKVGSCIYSDMTMFSFHPAKTLTTGEGGMVTTNNTDYYQRLLHFRDNGIDRIPQNIPYPGYYEVRNITGNFHLTSFQGALGLSQLARLNSFVQTRRQLVQCYRHHLRDFPHLSVFTDEQDAYSAFHLMVVQIDFAALDKDRSEVMEGLKKEGIGTQVHYVPLYRHPVLNLSSESWADQFPQMERYYAQALTLPLYFDLKEGEIERICKTLKKVSLR